MFAFSGGFLSFVEGVRSLWAAWAFFVGWNCSGRFGQRVLVSGGIVPFASGCGALHLSPANATGLGALAAAPPTPPAPPVTLAASRSPRLTASGSGSGEIRLPAFLALKPHPCGLPRPPANASARAMGPNTPRDNFRFLMGLKCRYAFKKIKRKAWIGGVISQRQKPLCKT